MRLLNFAQSDKGLKQDVILLTFLDKIRQTFTYFIAEELNNNCYVCRL